MRKGFDDTRVREARLERNPLYRNFSSPEFSIFLMFLIGIATLIAALFPQGMDEPFYIARFGERLYRIYDSLGLLGILRSWWFMLLFVLLFVALILCSHARVREGIARGIKGTKLYETDFSVPKSTEDVLLIFPVLLSSIGFRKRRIITGEGHWEIMAERGIHPSVSSLLLHVSAVLLLLGILLTYVFSWGGSLSLEAGNPVAVPFLSRASRWATFTGGWRLGQSEPQEREVLRLAVLTLTRYYGLMSGTLPTVSDSVFPRSGAIPAEQVFVTKGGRDFLLRGWKSHLSVARGKTIKTLDVSAGESKVAMGLEISQGPISKTARVAFPALGETIQVTLPTNLRFEEARVTAIPVQAPAVGRVFRLESSGSLGQSKVQIKVLPLNEKGDTATLPHEHAVNLGAGEEAQLEGVAIKVIRLSEWSLIRVRSDPGRRLVRLGALFIFLFTMIRLYVYCYMLRVEISPAKGGASHLSIKIRASGLLASPAGVARKIAGLVSK
jgi:hypothetical protein